MQCNKSHSAVTAAIAGGCPDGLLFPGREYGASGAALVLYRWLSTPATRAAIGLLAPLTPRGCPLRQPATPDSAIGRG